MHCDGNVLDECGVCGGSGIPYGKCDCDGNVLDVCGVCNGTGIPHGQCIAVVMFWTSVVFAGSVFLKANVIAMVTHLIQWDVVEAAVRFRR